MSYHSNIIMKVIACISLTLAMTIAFSNPALQGVQSGNVSVTQTPHTTVIHQSSQKAIINWHSFNINANEQTSFQQPKGGVALNHINPSQGASQIYGRLTATGQIILVNPAGLYFGPGAYVNVGGLIASTSEISNQNFLAGKYIFDQPSPYAGSIVNQGTIRAADYGLVALIGNSVENNGYIQARLGTVALASGSKFTVAMSGDQLINFTVNEGSSSAGVDKNGRVIKDGVKNTGTLIADGGTVLITARSAGAVLDHAINMEGIVEAKSVSNHKGMIILSGGSNGNVRVAANINVSGENQHQSGGTIKVLGAKINIVAPTVLNANGKDGGGNIYIGMDEQGLNRASTTSIARDVLINASALQSGHGGNILIWSDVATSVHGKINAMGGLQNGNGGNIETSGAYLNVSDISIDVSAPHGNTGTWLLDPENLFIQTAGSTTATPSGSPTNTYTANVDNSILTIADLLNALNSANVVVKTGSSGAQAGDIFVNDAITWANTNTLTLSAYHDINVLAPITNASGGSLTLRADNTGTGFGSINDVASINLSGGGAVKFYYNPSSFITPTTFSNVNVSGGTTFTPYMLVNNAAALQNMNSNLSGNYALGNNINLTGNFTPIGNSATAFLGNFDGQDYAINGLNIAALSPNDIGLFGQVTGGSIANFTLNNPVITVTTDLTGQSMFIGSVIGLSNAANVANISVINPLITANGTNHGINGSRGYYDVGGVIGATFGGSIQNVASLGGVINNHVHVNTIANMIAFNETGGLVGEVIGR